MTTENTPGASERYPHLNRDVAQVADRDAVARIKFLRQDRFIPYRAASDAMAELEDLLSWPDTVRPPCRMLLGESAMGKSAIFKEFESDHPASDNIGGDMALVPVFRMQFPETGSDGIYSEIIRKLNSEPVTAPSSSKLRSLALNILDRVGNRVLIIDEIANVITKDLNRQTIAMNATKFITNELERPIVLGVTPEAFTVVNKDKHLKTRFEPIFLPRFKDETGDNGGNDYREFLFGLEMALPLRKPSGLATDPEIAHEIMLRTHGITGNIVKLVVACARHAIASGEECITAETVKNVVWMDAETFRKNFDAL